MLFRISLCLFSPFVLVVKIPAKLLVHTCTPLYISMVTYRNKISHLFPQRDTDEEVKEHLRSNLHLQEKVM